MAALSPTISPAGHNEFKYKLTKLFFYMSSSCVFFYVSFYVSACVTGLKGRYASAFYVSSTNRYTQYSHKQYITKFTVCSYIIY